MASHVAYAELRQLLDVQFAVVVHVETYEFRVHEGHELGLGNFAVLVSVHEEQKLLGRVLAGRNFFLVRIFSLASKSGWSTKGDGGNAGRPTQKSSTIHFNLSSPFRIPGLQQARSS